MLGLAGLLRKTLINLRTQITVSGPETHSHEFEQLLLVLTDGRASVNSLGNTRQLRTGKATFVSVQV